MGSAVTATKKFSSKHCQKLRNAERGCREGMQSGVHEAAPWQVMCKLPLHNCLLLSLSFPHLVSAVQL